MKLIEETPARLVVEDRPWIIGTALTLGILLCLALAMGLFRESGWLTLGFGLASLLLAVLFVVFVRRVIVIFDRDAQALVIRTRSLTGDSETTLALADVTGAEVETSRSTSTSNDGSRNVSVTHRPVLTTRTGPIPLTQVYSSGSGAETIAAAVNRWLSTR
jgi:hypothetical protein